MNCYPSFSTWDVFSETLTLAQCNAASSSINGSCVSGNCDSDSGNCTTSECLSPFGSCSNGVNKTCQQCSLTYNTVYLTNMTVEICIQICMTTYAFNYAGLIYG